MADAINLEERHKKKETDVFDHVAWNALVLDVSNLFVDVLAKAASFEEARAQLIQAALFRLTEVLQPAFEQKTGHKLTIANDTAGGLQRRIKAGEAFDALHAVGLGAEFGVEDDVVEFGQAFGQRDRLVVVPEEFRVAETGTQNALVAGDDGVAAGGSSGFRGLLPSGATAPLAEEPQR